MKKFIAVNNYSLFYIIWPINVTFEAESKKKKKLESYQGAFIYDVRFLGRWVGQAASDFTKQAYVTSVS